MADGLVCFVLGVRYFYAVVFFYLLRHGPYKYFIRKYDMFERNTKFIT